MRVALYARVSSDDQADRETIKDQELLYEKWLDLHGHEDGGRYLDDGVTGTLPMADRPEGARLLEAIQRKEIDTIVFKNVKRLGRRTRVVLDFVEACDQAKASVISITEPFNTADPIGRFVVTMLAGISELDRENILEQTKAGIRRRARAGGWLGGKCAYGYRIEGRRHHAQLILGPESEQVIVREIFQELVGGGSCDAIAQRLTAQGVPSWSGKAWSAAVISRMIANPVYRGQHRYGDAREGSILPVSFADAPRIVDDVVWQRANDQIAKNRRLRGRAANRPYLLRGLIWCGQCGYAYTGQTINAQQAEETDHAKGVIYRCNWRVGAHRRADTERCASPSISGRVENDVWMAVVGVLQRPQVLQDAFRARLTTPTPAPDLSRLQSALADREEQRARILGLYRRGRITDAELDEQLSDVGAEVEALRGQLEALRMDAAKIDLANQQAETAVLEVTLLAESLQGRLDSLTRVEKAQVIGSLVEKIIVEQVDGKTALRIRFRFDSMIQPNGQINLLHQLLEFELSDLEKKLDDK